MKVVGSIYQEGSVDEVKLEKDSDSVDPKNADKMKARKLYVGTQALGYRRDYMEVRSLNLFFSLSETFPLT